MTTDDTTAYLHGAPVPLFTDATARALRAVFDAMRAEDLGFAATLATGFGPVRIELMEVDAAESATAAPATRIALGDALLDAERHVHQRATAWRWLDAMLRERTPPGAATPDAVLAADEVAR